MNRVAGADGDAGSGRELRLGLVGLGVISRFYLAAIDRMPGVRLGAVCDPDPARREPFLGSCPAFASHRKMLAGGTVDALVITAPNDLHAGICRDVLLAGLPVCVEKPLALEPATARELCDLAAVAGTVLFTAFHRRYNTGIAALLHALTSSRVDTVIVRYLERIEEHAGSDSWYLEPDRCGGGCLADNGPNAFDLVRHLLGPATVRAAAVRRDGRGIDRQAFVDLRTTSGIPVLVELDWAYPGECKTVETRFGDGTVSVVDMLAGHEGFKASLWHEYEGVVRDFVGRVRAGYAVPEPGTPAPEPGVAAVELVNRAYALAGQRCPPAPAGGRP